MSMLSGLKNKNNTYLNYEKYTEDIKEPLYSKYFLIG